MKNNECVELTLREAVPEDAEKVLDLMQQVGAETEFLVLDEAGVALTPELLALQLDGLYESENNLLLLAFDHTELIGSASVRASSDPKIAHIGEVGISILKAYWGMGLGSVLMEELLFWAQEEAPIYRLELTVQQRNARAVHLYEKFGFKTEATMARGARAADGEFLDVCLMSKLIH